MPTINIPPVDSPRPKNPTPVARPTIPAPRPLPPTTTHTHPPSVTLNPKLARPHSTRTTRTITRTEPFSFETEDSSGEVSIAGILLVGAISLIATGAFVGGGFLGTLTASSLLGTSITISQLLKAAEKLCFDKALEAAQATCGTAWRTLSTYEKKRMINIEYNKLMTLELQLTQQIQYKAQLMRQIQYQWKTKAEVEAERKKKKKKPAEFEFVCVNGIRTSRAESITQSAKLALALSIPDRVHAKVTPIYLHSNGAIIDIFFAAMRLLNLMPPSSAVNHEVVAALDTTVRELCDYINSTRAAGKPCNIIAHSGGNLAVLCALKRAVDISHVRWYSCGSPVNIVAEFGYRPTRDFVNPGDTVAESIGLRNGLFGLADSIRKFDPSMDKHAFDPHYINLLSVYFKTKICYRMGVAVDDAPTVQRGNPLSFFEALQDAMKKDYLRTQLPSDPPSPGPGGYIPGIGFMGLGCTIM
jgi:hypothetical protein